VVSFLEDARRDITPELTRALRNRYYDGIRFVDREIFDEWYAVLGAQRHAKVAGIFLRLFRCDGKSQYLKHLPRVVSLFSRHMSVMKLSPIQTWLENFLPDYLDPLPADQKRKRRTTCTIESAESPARF
jgi:hypothetical protein